MSAVDDAITEIDDALVVIEPIHEGLRDYERLNLQPATMAIVQQEIDDYDRRVDLLTDARTRLLALQADGHPDLPTRDVPQAVYEDLTSNKATIEAALGKFAPNTAASIGLEAGEIRPKDEPPDDEPPEPVSRKRAK